MPHCRHPLFARAAGALAATVLLFLPLAVQAQDSTKAKEAEERPTGLPSKATWTFNLNAGVGYFGYGQSLYTNERPDPSGDLGANWAEGYLKPAVSFTWPTGNSELYGKLSAVGERTYASPPDLVGTEASSYGLEDYYLGWRSGKTMSMGENVLDVRIGGSPYKLAQGLLLWDGGAEGGVRGGFWSNARVAWGQSAIVSFQPKNNELQLFYLKRNELPGRIQNTKLWGGNYQLTLPEHTTIGVTYMHFYSDSVATRDGENVINARVYTSPFKKLPDLNFELEYANEKNGDLLNSYGWYGQASYVLTHKWWTPKLTYRYAFFEGDDPTTATSEAFDPLYTGFYDWGSWWQGEIAGEYFLINSNLISHQLRLSLAPTKTVSSGLIAYQFMLDKAPAGITSTNVAFELDAYTDWQWNSNFTLSLVAAYASPHAAVQQATGRTKDFLYGMAYLAYAY